MPRTRRSSSVARNSIRKPLPQADRIYLTDIAGEVEADTFFPAPLPGQWRESVLGEHPADERNRFALRFFSSSARLRPGAVEPAQAPICRRA